MRSPGGQAVNEDTVVALPRPGSNLADDPLQGVLRAGARRMLPRATVLRDTALQVEGCKEVQDGRGRWDGRGPVGARPPRWRRRGPAPAPAAAVGAPPAGPRAPAAAGRGTGAGPARTPGHRRR